MDAHGYISAEEVRQALRSIYRSDAEANPRKSLCESLADELKPVNEKGRWRPSRVLVLAFWILCALAGVFVYFSIGGRS